MGDKPGHYWDHRECGWVRHQTPADDVVVPLQAQAVDAEVPVPSADAAGRQTPPLGTRS